MFSLLRRLLLPTLICTCLCSSQAAAVDSYPVALPHYKNVDQLLLLTNKWVIVATSDTEELVEKIDELSGGQFRPALQAWESSKTPIGSMPWKKVSKMSKQYWLKAREQAGERELNTTSYYTITSQDDKGYEQARSPSRVEKYIASQGWEKVPGFTAAYAHYSYLEMPKPLEDGKTYTITLKNGKEVTFLYDEMRSVSRLIKINQIGYLPDTTHKYAYLSGYIPGIGTIQELDNANTFEVITAYGGHVVHSGKITLRERDPRYHTPEKQQMSGEDVYQIDLSPIQQEGWYFIRVPGVGRSWPFKISSQIYGEAFYTAARGLYHQRCGMPLEAPYTAWTRETCHTSPAYESEHVPFMTNVKQPKGYKVFDVIGATFDYSRSTKDATGGWHDAGDWDKRMDHYIAIFDMLYAYEWHPERFTAGQLNIPAPTTFDIDQPIPDILLEVEYGLRVWKKSMTADGGVAGALETWAHPNFNDPNHDWAYSQRTRWASLAYAAAAAQYARLVMPFASKHAYEYGDSALKAYQFGTDPKNALTDGKGGPLEIHAKKDRGRKDPYSFYFQETFDHIAPYVIAAKMQLYLLTKHNSLLNPVPDAPDKDLQGLIKAELAMKRGPFKKPYYGDHDLAPWLYYGMFHPDLRERIGEQLTRLFEMQYLERAEQLVVMGEGDPYRRSHKRESYGRLAWAYGTLTNKARILLIAHHITGDAKFRDAALYNVDYMLGANPMGMSWTTGLGTVFPVEIHHNISRLDGIDEPVPGIAIFGPNGRRPWQLEQVWNPKDNHDTPVAFVEPEKLEIPMLRRWHAHPRYNVSQCEFTVHETMAPGIFSYALLMPDHWTAPPSLRQRQPRPISQLFGHWWLP